MKLSQFWGEITTSDQVLLSSWTAGICGYPAYSSGAIETGMEEKRKGTQEGSKLCVVHNSIKPEDHSKLYLIEMNVLKL